MQQPLRVGILGATGAVGQIFVQLLADHPWFEVTALAASKRSAGQTYRDAVNWIGNRPIPPHIADMTVQPTEPGLDCDFVFSGLSSSVAGDVERAFAAAGYPVISNAKNYRMQDDVPLLIPEVNPDHIKLIDEQDWGSDGYIVTNPNCSTVGLVCTLRPLVDAFGVETVQVTTLQALSGAGHPGVPSLDALGNVIPYIGGEEDKLATEPKKLLGTLQGGRISPADITVSAQCNRVPVKDGHTSCVSLTLAEDASPDDVRDVLRSFGSPLADKGLPSAPETFIHVDDAPDHPQPDRHVHRGRGMTVSVGRVRPCEVLDIKFVTLVHNTVRGAAGGAVLNAELLVQEGYLTPRPARAAAQA
jgi:aspartate-semialdehyde dehydrogenase